MRHLKLAGLLMKLNLILCIVSIHLLPDRGHSQCDLTIPADVKILDTASYIGGGLEEFWVCTQDTVVSDAGSNTFYMESESVLVGGGGSMIIYLKNCASFESYGGGGHTIYHEPDAIINDPGAGATIIPCAKLVFEYSEVDISSCDTTSCVLSGIQSFDNSILGVTVYPNPMIDRSYFEFSGSIGDGSLLTILNSRGETVFLDENVKSNGFEFQRGDINTGIYFYRIQNEKRIIASGKFLIN